MSRAEMVAIVMAKRQILLDRVEALSGFDVCYSGEIKDLLDKIKDLERYILEDK